MEKERKNLSESAGAQAGNKVSRPEEPCSVSRETDHLST
jgi:hypothetical protein